MDGRGWPDRLERNSEAMKKDTRRVFVIRIVSGSVFFIQRNSGSIINKPPIRQTLIFVG